jgi:hypothetical protein
MYLIISLTKSKSNYIKNQARDSRPVGSRPGF